MPSNEVKEQRCHICKWREAYRDATGIDHKWDTGCKFLCDLKGDDSYGVVSGGRLDRSRR